MSLPGFAAVAVMLIETVSPLVTKLELREFMLVEHVASELFELLVQSKVTSVSVGQVRLSVTVNPAGAIIFRRYIESAPLLVILKV